MNELKSDNNLRQAVSRREQQLPPMPADLNKRLMQRIAESEPARSETKPRRLWLYAAVAVAASIALLIVFHFGKEQTPQEPLVAKHIVEKPVVSEPDPVEEQVPEQVEGEPVAEKPKSVKKQRKVVMQLVELIPTSEAKSDNVKSLPESLIANVKAYDKQSDLSRTTGIDEGIDEVVEEGIDDTDPLVAMAAQVEDIRQRGMRLHEEIRQQMKN